MLIYKGDQIGILMCLFKCGQTQIEIKRKRMSQRMKKKNK